MPGSCDVEIVVGEWFSCMVTFCAFRMRDLSARIVFIAVFSLSSCFLRVSWRLGVCLC
jgi:hypothetical protein